MNACPIFTASRVKLRRAESHLLELRKEINAFLSSKPFKAVVRTENAQNQRITFSVRKMIPKELSAIIGDVIHNLRASLDLLACELVRLNGQSDDDVYFPFCRGAADLDEAIKQRHMDRAGQYVVDLIRTMRPYKGGNEMLRAIHDMDIRDKHQMLTPIANAANFGKVFWGHLTGISLSGGGQFFGPVEEGFTPFIFPNDPKLKVGQEIKAKYVLTLSPLDPLGGQEIVKTLHDLCELVAGIIESFETLCHTKSSPSSVAE